MPQILVDILKKLTKAPTKRKAVMGAITEEIRRQKLARFRSLAGHIQLDGSLLNLRHHDHRFR